MPAREEIKRQSNFFLTCSKCKTSYSCCNNTTPPITNKRRQIIEAYLREQEIPVRNPFVEAEYVFPRVDSDGYCVFHDRKTKRCLVHSVKPETCVAGPVTFDINVKTGKIEWYIKREELCQLAGIVYGDKEMLQKHLESAKKEVYRLVGELGSESLKAILRKEEPQTFKIGEDSAGMEILAKLGLG